MFASGVDSVYFTVVLDEDHQPYSNSILPYLGSVEMRGYFLNAENLSVTIYDPTDCSAMHFCQLATVAGGVGSNTGLVYTMVDRTRALKAAYFIIMLHFRTLS